MLNKLKQDSIYTGLFWGLLSMIGGYYVLFFLTDFINRTLDTTYLPAPKLQLILLAINVIIFRFVMLSFKKTETGKGILIVIFFTTLIYLIAHKEII
jgi:hypothetical protein